MADNLFTEDWTIVGVVDPDANTATTYLTAAIDMQDYEQLVGIVQVGDLGASASVSLAFQSASTSGGSYSTISGKTLTVGGTSPNTGSNTQETLSLRSAEVTSNNRYVKALMTVATATSDCSAIVLGKARHRPASDFNISTVTVN